MVARTLLPIDLQVTELGVRVHHEKVKNAIKIFHNDFPPQWLQAQAMPLERLQPPTVAASSYFPFECSLPSSCLHSLQPLGLLQEEPFSADHVQQRGPPICPRGQACLVIR